MKNETIKGDIGMSWKKAKLCSVAKIGAGQSAPKDSDFSVNDGLPFIRAGHLEQLIANDNIVALPTINEEKSSKNKLKVLKKGSILFAKSGMSAMMNRAYLIEKDAYYVSHLASVTPNNSVLDSRFCYYFLKHFKTSKLIKDSAYPSIGLPDIENIEIPLPPLSIQKRIAEILDAADALRRKDQELLRKYDELAQAIFIDMFGDPVKNEKGWEVKRLGLCIQNIIAGSSYGGEDKVLDEDELGVLKISAVTKGYFNPREFKAVKKQQITKEIITVKKGDLLFSRANTRELVGATCIVDKDYSKLFLPDKLWKIELKNNSDSAFINYLLKQETVRYELNKTATGTSGSMLNISMPKLKELLIILPPASKQLEFRDKIIKLSDNVILCQTIQIKSETLFDSLLQQAFKGELVK